LIADTTFLSHLLRERECGPGPATLFLAAHRRETFLVTVISVGELAVLFDTTREARLFVQRYRQLRLFPEVAYAAAEVDRELIAQGLRLGENDNWIAGFCRYYGQLLISQDAAFDRVAGLRRLAY
jgi:predicted nucleic acid-binding protein